MYTFYLVILYEMSDHLFEDILGLKSESETVHINRQVDEIESIWESRVHQVESVNRKLEQEVQVWMECSKSLATELSEVQSLMESVTQERSQIETTSRKAFVQIHDKQIQLENAIHVNSTELDYLYEKNAQLEHMIRVNKDELDYLREKITRLETVQQGSYFDKATYSIVPIPSRWEDPRNIACKDPYHEKVKNPVDYNEWIDHIWCDCYNCHLNSIMFYNKSKYKEYGSNSYSTVIRPFCPLDSECTCLNVEHRSYYKHSLEMGIIKGRDLELSPIHIRIILSNKGLLGKRRIVIIGKFMPSGSTYTQISNITQCKGVDVFQYRGDGGIIHNATKDDLFYVNSNNELEEKVF